MSLMLKIGVVEHNAVTACMPMTATLGISMDEAGAQVPEGRAPALPSTATSSGTSWARSC